MDWTGVIGVVMGTISTIVCAWFGYNQYAKNKEIDHKIARREQEDKDQRKREKVASQNIYRELWSLLYSIEGALRVYIVQPHPLDRAKFISVQFEVLSEGMVSIIPMVHRMPISNLPGFVVELESNDFLAWRSQSAVRDGRARSVMHQIGTDKMYAVRMVDGEIWKGNIVVDMNNGDVNEEALKERLMEAKTIVQYMLPEIEED